MWRASVPLRAQAVLKLLREPTKSTGADSVVAKMNTVQIEFFWSADISQRALEAILKVSRVPDKSEVRLYTSTTRKLTWTFLAFDLERFHVLTKLED